MESQKYFFLLSYTVTNQSGIAFVVADTSVNAFQCLKNAGLYNSTPSVYVLNECKNVGKYAGGSYGLLLESYTNAMVTYDAFCKVFNDLVIESSPVSYPTGVYDDIADTHVVEGKDQADIAKVWKGKVLNAKFKNYFSKTGDTLTGNLILDRVSVMGRTSGGVNYHLVSLSGDEVRLGNNSFPTRIFSNGYLTHKVGNNEYNIYDTSYFDYTKLLASADYLQWATSDDDHALLPLTAGTIDFGSSSKYLNQIYGDKVIANEIYPFNNQSGVIGSASLTFSEAYINAVHAGTLYEGVNPISSKYIAKSIFEAKGDIIYASGAGALQRLEKGSDGQILVLANGVPIWANASMGTWTGYSDVTFHEEYGILFDDNASINYYSGLDLRSSGDIYLDTTETVYGYGNWDTTGTVTALGFIDSSDSRKKNKIEDVELSLEDINSIPLIAFRYKTEDNSARHVGVFAQDVQEVLPEVVQEDKEGFLGVNYAALATAVGLSLAKEVDALKQEIQSLKAELHQQQGS